MTTTHSLQLQENAKQRLVPRYVKQRLVPRNVTNLDKFNSSEQVRHVEKEIVDRGKSAFAAAPEELQAEIEYYARKYPDIKFYKCQDSLISKPTGISTENPEVSEIPRNAYTLVESGIYRILLKEKHGRKKFKREQAGVWTPSRETMTMDGCIATLFILYGGVAAGASLICGIESCGFKGQISMYLTKCWRKVVMKLIGFCRSCKH